MKEKGDLILSAAAVVTALIYIVTVIYSVFKEKRENESFRKYTADLIALENKPAEEDNVEENQEKIVV